MRTQMKREGGVRVRVCASVCVYTGALFCVRVAMACAYGDVCR